MGTGKQKGADQIRPLYFRGRGGRFRVGPFFLSPAPIFSKGLIVLVELLKKEKGSIMLEFALCGMLFIGFIMIMTVLGLWMYNTSHVSQAARIAALNMSVTNNPAEAQNKALTYLNKTLIACSNKSVTVYSDADSGYGIAQAGMKPLFPGVQKLIAPKGTSSIGGAVLIRKEATAPRAHRFRPENRQFYN